MHSNMVRLVVAIIAFGIAVALPVALWAEWNPVAAPASQGAETENEPARKRRARDVTASPSSEQQNGETPRQQDG